MHFGFLTMGMRHVLVYSEYLERIDQIGATMPLATLWQLPSSIPPISLNSVHATCTYRSTRLTIHVFASDVTPSRPPQLSGPLPFAPHPSSPTARHLPPSPRRHPRPRRPPTLSAGRRPTRPPRRRRRSRTARPRNRIRRAPSRRRGGHVRRAQYVLVRWPTTDEVVASGLTD